MKLTLLSNDEVADIRAIYDCKPYGTYNFARAVENAVIAKCKDQLEAELAKRDADIERWKSNENLQMQRAIKAEAELEKKDAEIAKLKTLSLTLWAERHSASEVDALKAEVERLTAELKDMRDAPENWQ